MSTPLRLGVLGCGVVGSALVRAVREDARLAERFSVTGIAVRDLHKARTCTIHPGELSTDPVATALRSDVNAVVELMGGVDVARTAVEAALDAGKPVVTANKALLAEAGPALRALAAARGVSLRYEAAVAGAIPVVRTVARLSRTDEIQRIDAVLNGTSNFVLSTMAADGVPLSVALEAARRLGYAEADASRDLDGTDAADKLVVLAQLAWGSELRTDEVYRQGIEWISPRDVTRPPGGRVWRLVASATPDGCARVEPLLLPPAHPLARLQGPDNAVVLTARRAGVITLQGAGAGGEATASAVLGDLADLATDTPYVLS